jgi:hypothetical protein
MSFLRFVFVFHRTAVMLFLQSRQYLCSGPATLDQPVAKIFTVLLRAVVIPFSRLRTGD